MNLDFSIKDPEHALNDVISWANAYKNSTTVHVNDVQELIPTILEKRAEELAHQLALFQKHPNTTLYHVGYTRYEDRIATYGIFHDERATLTPSLQIAVAYALVKGYWAPASIHQVDVELDKLFLDESNSKGPGYVPKAKREKESITDEQLPTVFRNHIFKEKGMDFAYWLEPHHIKEVVYRTGHESLDHVVDRANRT